MTSLGALSAPFFEGGLVKKVVTAYSGNSFPTYTPNPIFRQAYESGAVEVEHWSILTLSQRLEAAARGLPAAVTGSLVGSSMAENDAFTVIDSPFGPLGLLQPLAPDVALVHAAAADPAGNLVFSEPLLDGVWGAWAARRGVVATVERIVDDLEGLGHRVRVPGHRVLAVVEAPYGAHPGGCYAPGLPVRSYGEDIAHWSAAADAAAKRRVRRLRAGLGVRPEDARGLPGPRRHRTTALARGTLGPDVVEGGRRRPSRRRGSEREHVGAGRLPRCPRGGACRGRGRRRRSAGRGGCRQSGSVGGRRAGPGGGTPGHAHRRARSVGVPAHAGRSLHLQPAGLSVRPPICPTPRPYSGW